jgi:hypothetical protein
MEAPAVNPGRPLRPVGPDDIPVEFALLRSCLAEMPDPRGAKGLEGPYG